MFDEINHFALEIQSVQPVDAQNTARTDTIVLHQFAGDDVFRNLLRCERGGFVLGGSESLGRAIEHHTLVEITFGTTTLASATMQTVIPSVSVNGHLRLCARPLPV